MTWYNAENMMQGLAIQATNIAHMAVLTSLPLASRRRCNDGIGLLHTAEDALVVIEAGSGDGIGTVQNVERDDGLDGEEIVAERGGAHNADGVNEGGIGGGIGGPEGDDVVAEDAAEGAKDRKGKEDGDDEAHEDLNAQHSPLGAVHPIQQGLRCLPNGCPSLSPTCRSIFLVFLSALFGRFCCNTNTTPVVVTADHYSS